MNTIETFNQALFMTINATPATPAWLIGTALVFANYLIWLIPLGLVMMWLSGDIQQRGLAIRACVVTLLALGANQVIGLVWPHPRPFMIGLGHTFLQHAADSSFPSDHGTVFSAVALTLLRGRMVRTGSMTVAAGIVVAWARIFLGVHFPLDMIGAAAVPCIVYAATAPLWNAGGSTLTRLVVALYRTLLARPIGLGWLRP
ncbi:phosphatase PAP2 family protein [Paraburkholderia susongensis]|uniref:Undecaprenyl-diphosphatase n=1 Tax=Paraburkholderia susongensis TaxID=1515439 RepID=A0A1X7M4T9_9BURK|nr:phosphatase PAP2 family protein [Paraburkholderia susongensis]SMG60990.1 undecaprenyl-diphosphatase [Paraburkholderia susongensis]